MRTSIATVSLSGTLEAKLQASAAAGFDGAELFEPDLIASTRTPEQVRDLATSLGLTLDLYQPFRDIEGVGPAAFADNLRRARHKFELMNRLGIPAILVCSNVGTATIDDDDLAAEQLHRLGELAADHGVRVAYEALAWGRFVNTYQRAWRLVRRADHPNVGICLDNFHISSRGDDPRDIEKIPAEKIEFVQLADAPLLRMDLLSWSRHHRVFPGQGGWDVPDFLGRVLRAGYRGPISLEVFNDTFRQTDVDRTAADGMRSLRWLEEQTAERLQGTAGAADAPAAAVPLRRLTPVGPPTGVDFVEVRGQEGLELLDEVLAHLGFSYSGTHPTRPMRLWTLAGARVVLHEASTPQGRPALTGIGLRATTRPVRWPVPPSSWCPECPLTAARQATRPVACSPRTAHRSSSPAPTQRGRGSSPWPPTTREPTSPRAAIPASRIASTTSTSTSPGSTSRKGCCSCRPRSGSSRCRRSTSPARSVSCAAR